jgi:hypothetical protein
VGTNLLELLLPMAVKLVEIRTNHLGEALPKGVYGCALESGEIVSYKVRWREQDENGVTGQRSKSFNAVKIGSLDRALAAALSYAAEAAAIIKAEGAIAKVDAAGVMTVDDVFKEWLVKHAATLTEAYGKKAARLWESEVATRPLARVRLDRLSEDTGIVVRFQDSLVTDGVPSPKRAGVLKLLRGVLRWGRKRYPNALKVELSGLFDIPTQTKQRLTYAADAYGLERIIEAVLNRPARDDLLPLRDAALIAAMGFTIAARPSEWLYSATWEHLHSNSIELQRSRRKVEENAGGLKTGARAALLLPNAYDRLLTYREALEDRWGQQPDHALVFQVLGRDGPVWITQPDGDEPVPLAWSKDEYDRWASRVWRPARKIASQAEGAPKGMAAMTFYDCRHTAISMALHSTLVIGPHGMNLHNLAGWAGHDIDTLQRYYAHFIARYLGASPIDLEQECAAAREAVEADPFKPTEKPASPQRAAHQRRRARHRVAAGSARR